MWQFQLILSELFSYVHKLLACCFGLVMIAKYRFSRNSRSLVYNKSLLCSILIPNYSPNRCAERLLTPFYAVVRMEGKGRGGGGG